MQAADSPRGKQRRGGAAPLLPSSHRPRPFCAQHSSKWSYKGSKEANGSDFGGILQERIESDKEQKGGAETGK